MFEFLVHSLGDNSESLEESRSRTSAVLHSVLLRCICVKETEVSLQTLASHVVDVLDRFLSDPALFISTVGSSLRGEVVLNSTTPLLALLANPCFLHCMVIKSCNNANAPGFLSCVRLTDSLCDYAVRHLRAHYRVGLDDGECHSAWVPWHKLLCPLQILLWICEEQQNMEESSRRGIHGFLEYLQVHYTDNESSFIFTSDFDSRIISLFSRAESVRVLVGLRSCQFLSTKSVTGPVPQPPAGQGARCSQSVPRLRPSH